MQFKFSAQWFNNESINKIASTICSVITGLDRNNYDEPQYLKVVKVKRQVQIILTADGVEEAECPYCALLHAEGMHDSSPTPCDGRPPILHGLHENI